MQEFLTELALVLLPRGMTPKRFSELARCAFVNAAADISRLRNGRVNHSRVAAQTGLTRADVKRLLRYSGLTSPTLGQTPVEKVIHGWRADRRFGVRGRPRALAISGPRASFADLVRKYGGDVPHRAVLDELQRIGAVRSYGGRVSLRSGVSLRRRQDLAFLSPILPALVDALQIASQKASSHSSVQRLCLPVDSEIDLAIVKNRCASSAKSMLEDVLHSLGKQVTVPRRGKSPAYSFTITVLLAESQTRKPRRPYPLT